MIYLPLLSRKQDDTFILDSRPAIGAKSLPRARHVPVLILGKAEMGECRTMPGCYWLALAAPNMIFDV